MKNNKFVVVGLLCLALSPALVFAKKATSRSRAPAPIKYSDFPRLMTARELLAMGPVKRKAYMQNFRTLLNELDKMAFLQLGTLTASASEMEQQEAQERFASKYEGFFDLMEGMLPQAHAAECGDPRYPFSVGGLCGAMCAARPIGDDETGRAVDNVYFCFPRNDYNKWSQANNGQGQMQLAPEERKALDFPGTWEERKPQILQAQRARAEQVHDEIQAREDAELGLAMRRAQRAAERQQEISDNIDRDDAQTGAAMMRMQKVADREREIAANADRDDAETGRQMREMQISANLDREDAQTGEAMRKAQEESVRLAEMERTVREQSEKNVKLAAGAPPTSEKTKVTEGSGPAVIPEAGKSGGKCTPSQLSCQNRDEYLKKSHRKALKTFRSAKPQSCVSAGNMSRYQNNEIKAGNCELKSDFCVRKSDCEKPAAASENGFMSRYTCAKGQSICSPFVYGLENKTTAVCVPSTGRHLTEACDTKAAALEKSPNYVKDFLAVAPLGVSEAWDEYADSFNDTCKQKTESQDAHCLECGIIGRRLKDARKLASGSCTDALSYNQTRPGTPAAPAAPVTPAAPAGTNR